MKCSKCGFNSFDYLDRCKKCNAPLKAKPLFKFLYEKDDRKYLKVTVSSDKTDSNFTSVYENQDQESNESEFTAPKQVNQIGFITDSFEPDLNNVDDKKRDVFSAPSTINQIKENIEEIERERTESAVDDFSRDFQEDLFGDVALNENEIDDFNPVPKQILEQYYLSYKSKINAFFEKIYDLFLGKINYSRSVGGEKDVIFGDYIPASIESRFLAFLIDLFILFFLSTFTFIFGIKLVGINQNIQIPNLYEILVWVYLILFVLATTYFVIFIAYCGQTIGKIIMKIKIVRNDGSNVNVTESLIRWLGYYISILPFCIGLLWIIFDIKNQSFHDKLAKTVVVRV